MSTADKIIAFYRQLNPDWALPSGFDLIYPFEHEETWMAVTHFYKKYFEDHNDRRLILGINPGRFGAGVTGIPFTDPKILEEVCGIPNSFHKRNELSALFIYEWIEAYGGIEDFYNDYWISSICPLGFLTDGINCNYYDDKNLYEAVKPHIVDQMWKQLEIGINRDIAFSLGKGQNFKYLKKLNTEYQFFEKVVALPHPRWIMQYRRKSKDRIMAEMIDAIKIENC